MSLFNLRNVESFFQLQMASVIFSFMFIYVHVDFYRYICVEKQNQIFVRRMMDMIQMNKYNIIYY